MHSQPKELQDLQVLECSCVRQCVSDSALPEISDESREVPTSKREHTILPNSFSFLVLYSLYLFYTFLGSFSMPYQGNKRKKSRTHKASTDSALGSEKIPKTFVVRRGKVDKVVREMVENFRDVMMPHTAARLKERK